MERPTVWQKVGEISIEDCLTQQQRELLAAKNSGIIPSHWNTVSALKPDYLNVRMTLESGEVKYEKIYIAHRQTKGEALRERFGLSVTDEALRAAGIIE